MKSKARKSIALLLSICICISLLPTMAAGIEKPTDIVRIDVKTLADIPTSFGGQILTYEAKTDSTNGDYVAVTLGTYNVPKSNAWSLRLQFDPNVVEACDSSGAVVDEDMQSITFSIPWLKAGVAKYTDAMLLSSLEESIKTVMKKKQLIDDTNGFLNPTVMFKVEGENANHLKIDVAMAPEVPANALSRVVGISTLPGAYTQPENAPVNFYTMYFKVKTGQTVDSNTFVTYRDEDCENAGAKTGLMGEINTYGACFVGFPQPAAVTYNVPFEVTATAATDTKVYLPNPAVVTITKQSGGETKSYQSNSTGQLLSDTGAALNPESTVKLEAGEYNYTVTPHADDSTYAANSGTFTVDTNNTTAKQLHARPKDEAVAETYTFSLFDGESVKNDALLADAVAQVGGKTATNNGGAISFQAIPGSSPTLNISKTGYKTLVGSVTVGAAGTISSMTDITYKDGGVVMDQTRTNVTVEANAGGDALTDAIITVSENPAEDKTVTPNMAANELPMVKKADTNGKASFNLPDGDYLYTIRAGGYNDTVKSLAIKPTTVTVADADGTNSQTPINKGAADAEGDFKVEISAATAGTPDPILEPMYYVEGKLDNEANPTKMTVEVYLKNANATTGSFGLKYDPALFTLAADGFAKSTNIGIVPSYNVDNKGSYSNPTSAEGYHAFQWDAATASVDASSKAQLIGTYTLVLKPGFSKDKLHSKSLCVAPYSKTAAATQILNAYAVTDGKPTADEIRYTNEFIARMWRPATANNVGSPADAHRLPESLATEGGFYQIYKTGEAPPMDSSDARAQFVFDNSGATGVTFSVNETADGSTVGAPISGATIEIKDGGKEFKTVTTDQYGDAIVGLPADGTYTYSVTCIGYQTVKDVAVLPNTDPIQVLMGADKSHKVRVATEQIDKIDLLGAGRAQNLAAYTFNLQPKEGYKWKNAGGPTPAQITFKLIEGANIIDIASSNITWNAVTSRYTLDGDAIKGDAKQDLVVSVVDDAITETTTVNAPTITVKAVGTGGEFVVTPVVDGGSGFAPALPTGAPFDINNVVETLGANKGVSATYAFKEGGKAGTGEIPTTGTYEANIIHKLLINGTEVGLTDYQRIYGVSKQLIGINNNQTMTAVYEKATVDLKGSGKEDDTISKEPAIEPTANPRVSIIVGEGGAAAVTVSDPSATGTITGPGRAEYEVKTTDGTLTAAITPAAALAQPDGTTKKYVIDTVMVDRVKVNEGTPSTGITWTPGTNTLALTGLAVGSIHTVAVTFKPDGSATSTEAILNTVHRDGNGKITPLGTNIYKVNDCPTIEFLPDDQWALGELMLTEPADKPEAKDVLEQVENSAYKLPAMKAGTTELAYAFVEEGFEVEIGIDYTIGTQPKAGATITFERAAGNGLPYLRLPYTMPTGGVQTTGRFAVPEGTWKVILEKDGYLRYTVTGFTIANDGNSDGTYVDGKVIYFGKKDAGSETKRIKPFIGDANRDKYLIALDDAAQVLEGMIQGAASGSIDYADLDESGGADAGDQKYVTGNYGKREIVRTYTDFMTAAK